MKNPCMFGTTSFLQYFGPQLVESISVGTNGYGELIVFTLLSTLQGYCKELI